MSPGTPRLAGLDGVRALAVLAVLAYHDGRLRGGFLGVSVFFTLSGFLITRLLVAERAAAGRISLRRFFGRRVRRLLPAALAGVVLAALVSTFLAGGRDRIRGDGIAAIGNVANWRFLFDGRSYADIFESPAPLAHFWSLAVEEQFYFVLAPLMVGLLALGKGSRAYITAGVVALVASSFAAGWIIVEHAGLDRSYYGTDTRAVEFLLGALLALVMAGRSLPRAASRVFAGGAVVAALALGWATATARETDPNLFRGGLLVHAALVCVVLVGVSEPGPLRALCSFRPLVALGVISYGVYLFHWPLFLVIDEQRTGLAAISVTALRLAATVALAAASYFVLESPILEGRGLRRAGWAVAPAAIAVVLAVVITISTTAPPPAIRFEPVSSSAAVIDAPASPPLDRDVGPPAPVAPERPKVLVVGDSVALTLGRGIERWGAATGVRVDNQASLGCTLLEDLLVRGYWGTAERGRDQCDPPEGWRALVDLERPDVIVVHYGAWEVYEASWDGGESWWEPGDAEWDTRYAAVASEAAGALSATGGRVLWLTPPCFGKAPGDRRDEGPWFGRERVAALGRILDGVARTNGITVSHTLTESGCPVDLDVRPDGVHYSDPGADAATALLVPQVEALLRATDGR